MEVAIFNESVLERCFDTIIDVENVYRIERDIVDAEDVDKFNRRADRAKKHASPETVAAIERAQNTLANFIEFLDPLNYNLSSIMVEEVVRGFHFEDQIGAMLIKLRDDGASDSIPNSFAAALEKVADIFIANVTQEYGNAQHHLLEDKDIIIKRLNYLGKKLKKHEDVVEELNTFASVLENAVEKLNTTREVGADFSAFMKAAITEAQNHFDELYIQLLKTSNARMAQVIPAPGDETVVEDPTAEG